MASSLDGPMIIGVAAWIVYLISMAGSRFAARTKALRDHPNHRSSHTRPTPKTGGLAMIGAWLAGMFVIGVFTGLPETALAALLLSILAIFALGVGLADDLFDMPPLWKFAGQFAVAGLFILAFAPLQGAPVPFFGYAELGAAGVFLTVFWIAGFMNAYNFMDGANGLAAGCAGLGLCGFSIIASFSGAPFAAAAALLLAVAAFGFMPVNLKKGRLFMGDNGSQAISFLIAALAVIGANATGGRISALALPTIFLPFLLDVAFTLTHRAMRGKNVLAGHREHIYQLLMRMGASHARVAVIYMTLTAAATAVAILMLALPPAYQWLAPAVLATGLGFGALKIYRKARLAGLLPDGEETSASDTAQEAGPARHAAE